ncbi:centrosomal protein kizuna isoform X2 [Latimeria chalumnae]|uniref:centrosomal protein kizuna isoform X2 n=1 Tax=Latimeria chalumnae TaxID=7897 RepID=UPI0006D9151E|nr:PREDICTED: centrosomal protein kizuna isoform X2 [Latimeria chalumnae]|eukprot:XP_014351285.1 PREDICTED: centrosomal protein kizuna isoform X2 [Latimeria chalumnae]
MAFSGTEYFEKIGNLQLELHESEKKRLELERKLFEYCKSDQRICKLKSQKLQNYLKEIRDRERRALIRNQQFLKDFDCVETHIMSLATGKDTLLQMKEEYEKQIERLLPQWKNEIMIRSKQKEFRSHQVLLISRQTDSGKDLKLSRGLYHPATIFMGRQMLGSSNFEFASTLQATPHATESFTVPYTYTHATASNSRSVTDTFKLPANNLARNLSKSDTDTKANHPTSEKMPLLSLPSSSKTENNNCTKNASITESRELFERSFNLRLSQTRSTFRNESSMLKSSKSKRLMIEHLSEHQPTPSVTPSLNDPSLSQSVSDRQDRLDIYSVADRSREQLNAMQNQNIQGLAGENFDTDSDLTISVSESEEHKRPLKCNSNVKRGGKSETTEGPVMIDTNQTSKMLFSQGSNTSSSPKLNCRAADDVSLTEQPIGGKCLSIEGFIHLLQSIEELIKKAELEHFELYQVTTITPEKLEEIISLCNQKNSVNSDLDACGAVVLDQLQKLSWSTSNGCLIPESRLAMSSCSTDEKKLRLSLPSDSAYLWEHWYRHALFLIDHHILTRDRIAEVSGPLLIEKNSIKSNEAIALLKEIFPEKAEESLSFHSNDSSCSLPSVLNDSGEIKQAKPAQWLYSTVTGEQETTSCGEDESKVERLIENIPIKETKAYERLKQSAVQQSCQLSEEDEDDLSELELAGLKESNNDVNTGQEEKVNSEASCSSNQESPQTSILGRI